jgi:hypothetical protein
MGADMPDNIPIPLPRPDANVLPAEKPGMKPDINVKPDIKLNPDAKPLTTDQAIPTEQPQAYVPPPIEKEDPGALKTCLSELDAIGVEYKPLPTIEDSNGCGIDKPFAISAIGNGIKLQPEGQMRCATALQLAHWTHDIVTPMLKTARPEETLVGLDQASTYVCRKRNSATTGKISEHAHGNAVDIAGFRFKSGNTFLIKPRMQDSTLDGAFQRAITTAACLYFTTVLDPASDKAHETHLHLDVLKRKGGFRYCW